MKDLDGKPVKLERLQGESRRPRFLGDLVRSRIELIPGRRELSKKYDGKPFAPISISADQDPRTCSNSRKRRRCPGSSGSTALSVVSA